VGFIGGGIIFVYRDSVRGLTTAASVWLTAAVGAAAGAGLALLAAIATAGYFLAIIGLPPLGHAVTRRLGIGAPALQVRYHDGRGLLRRILATVTDAGFHIVGVDTTRQGARLPAAADHRAATTEVEVTVQIQGRASLTELVSRLTEIEGVLAVETTEGEEPY
jgi:putative Mg2+ transporter-C (MgtC) family protein